jgi:hypothetical protein
LDAGAKAVAEAAEMTRMIVDSFIVAELETE